MKHIFPALVSILLIGTSPAFAGTPQSIRGDFDGDGLTDQAALDLARGKVVIVVSLGAGGTVYLQTNTTTLDNAEVALASAGSVHKDSRNGATVRIDVDGIIYRDLEASETLYCWENGKFRKHSIADQYKAAVLMDGSLSRSDKTRLDVSPLRKLSFGRSHTPIVLIKRNSNQDRVPTFHFDLNQCRGFAGGRYIMEK